MTLKNLPRLLYIGDVPVESTVGGSALLYRLLQNYPVERLHIFESNLATSQPQQRLPKVTYGDFSLGFKRPLHSRFTRIYTSYLVKAAQWKTASVNPLIHHFKPDAILTVAHGFSWLIAAKLATQYNLPLHLIVHDDWSSFINVIPMLRGTVEQQFGKVYCQAQSRLCVSPYMMEYYERQYGVSGTVLYPSRAIDVPVFNQPPERSLNRDSSLLFAYAGTINTQSYADSLITLSSVLRESGDRLVIYSSLTDLSIQQYGLDQPNITIHPVIPSQALIQTLRQQADVLFVPMSFDLAYRSNTEMSFPSKLTDYTAIGLPLLIWGPAYASAVCWAKENPGVGEVVDTQETAVFASAVRRLSQDAEYRSQLAMSALAKGLEYFSHENGIQRFYQAITATVDKPPDYAPSRVA